MPKVVYQEPGGTLQEVEVPVGLSLMKGAVRGGVEGIDAECGGCCSCATCHVYVDPGFLDRLAPPDADETALLSGVAAERKPNSRLSCQIEMRAELAGIVVQVPERQY